MKDDVRTSGYSQQSVDLGDGNRSHPESDPWQHSRPSALGLFVVLATHQSRRKRLDKVERLGEVCLVHFVGDVISFDRGGGFSGLDRGVDARLQQQVGMSGSSMHGPVVVPLARYR